MHFSITVCIISYSIILLYVLTARKAVYRLACGRALLRFLAKAESFNGLIRSGHKIHDTILLASSSSDEQNRNRQK